MFFFIFYQNGLLKESFVLFRAFGSGKSTDSGPLWRCTKFSTHHEYGKPSNPKRVGPQSFIEVGLYWLVLVLVLGCFLCFLREGVHPCIASRFGKVFRGFGKVF